MENILRLDNTKRSCFHQCPRKYYWQFRRNLRSISGSTALRYGSTWHAALEGYYRFIQQHGWDFTPELLVHVASEASKEWKAQEQYLSYPYLDYRTLDNCLLAFTEYINHYSADRNYLEIVEVEKVFEIPIYTTDQNVPVAYFTGKIDGLFRLNGALWLFEHKTTSQSLSMQMARIQRDPQIIGYSYAGHRLFFDEVDQPQGIIVSTHHLSSYKSKKTETWGSPKIEFERRPQIFTQGDYDSWLDSFIYTAEAVAKAQLFDHFPMQFDSCYHFGKCSYTDLCEQNANPDNAITDGFVEVPPWEVEKT